MLSLSNKKWIVANPSSERVSSLVRELEISPLLAKLMVNRKQETPEQGRFLIDDDLGSLHDPFLMRGMKTAADRIVRAVNHKESITVFADYDVDGITSAALLVHFFRDLGTPIDWYLPDRLREGYGLNEQALSDIRARGADLLITADCGITAVHEVKAAHAMGLDVIVTDHHQVGEAGLPEAVAVLNPHQPDCRYPFRFLSGVGIIFKVVTAVRTTLFRAGWKKNQLPNLKQYLDLCALGTIVDVAPLTGENHVLTSHGLEEIATTRKPGLTALKAVAGLDGAIDARAVGFGLGPRLNAAGRLGKADVGLHLLTSNELNEAMELAKTLDNVNRERQKIQRNTQEEAEYQMEKYFDPDKDRVIVLASEQFHRGVVGIVAARLVDKHHRPAILIALKDGMGQGSGRSIPKFNLYKALSECSALFKQFGGHAYAAGLSMEESNVDAFRKTINAIGHRVLTEEHLIPELAVETVLNLEDVTFDRHRELQRLSPFGTGNPLPVFWSERVAVRGIRFIGAQGRTVRFKAVQGETSQDVIAFGMRDIFQNAVSEGDEMDLAYEIHINDWGGRKKLELHLVDARRPLLDSKPRDQV